MRAAYVCADKGVPVSGQKGASIHIQEVIRALLKKKIEVEVFAANNGAQPLLGLEALAVHNLPFFYDIKPVSKSEIDKANQELRAAFAGGRDFDLVYERYSLWSFGAMEYARARSITGILEVNSPLIEEELTYRGGIDRTLSEYSAKRVLAAASVVIAVSEEVADYARGYLDPKERAKVYVVPNGVDPARFPERTTPLYPAAPGSFTVGFLGTLKPWHGVRDLIAALDILRETAAGSRILIVGDGPQKSALLQELAGRGLSERARFTGAVAPREVAGCMASMDVGVAPYPVLPRFYFSPLKIFEYMAAGLAIVASDSGQIKQLIAHEDNGLLYPAGDIRALAGALERLYCFPELRRRLGQNARCAVLENWTWDKIVERVLAIAGQIK